MTTAKPDSPTPWGLVALLGSLTAVGPLAIDMYLPSLPAIGRDLHAMAGQTQDTVAVFFAGLALGQLLYGPASDRFGRRTPILAGLCLFAAAGLVCATANSLAVLVAGRLLQSMGACASLVIARAIVRDRFNHQDSARMLSLLAVIGGAAPTLAPLFGSVLLQVTGWRGIFLALSGFGLVVMVAAALRLPESRSEAIAQQARDEHPFTSYWTLLRQRRLLGYLLGGALNSACMFTYISSSPAVLIGDYGLSPTNFSLLFAMNSVGLVGGAQLNRILLRRHSADQVLGVCAIGGALCGVGLGFAAVTRFGGLVGLLAPLFLTIASTSVIQANTMAGGLSVDPSRAGSASALFGAGAFGLGAATAFLSGAAADGTARPMAFVITACLFGCAASLHGLAFRRNVQYTASP